MSGGRLATIWLSGCSGCHMSLLNLHERLLPLLERCQLVYSPLMDIKEFPDAVDITLVEGAVGNHENRAMAELIRRHSRIVVSLGDCAANGNVSALRNPCGRTPVLETVYSPPPPGAAELEERVMPLHRIIMVDAFITGCPPEPDRIAAAVGELLEKLAPSS